MKKLLFYSIIYGLLLLSSCGISDNTLPEGRSILLWHDGFQADDYFKFGNYMDEHEIISPSYYFGGGHGSPALEYPPSYWLHFNEERNQLEYNNVIPPMDNHPDFGVSVSYMENDSIFRIDIDWARLGEPEGGEGFCYISAIISPQLHPLIYDTDYGFSGTYYDETGKLIRPGVTIVERGGILIETEISHEYIQRIMFEKEGLWYLIRNTSTDGYEEMVMLLEWFWRHPFDIDRFS